MDIDGDYLYGGRQLEDIDHMFRQCLCTIVWNNLFGMCPNPVSSSIHFLNWIEWFWKYRHLQEIVSLFIRENIRHYLGYLDM